MQAYIDKVKEDLEQIFTQLSGSTNTFRVGMVSYQDFPPEGTYGGRVELEFTDDIAKVRSSLASLVVEGGGDVREAVHTGVLVALEGLKWRDAVTKIMLVIGKFLPHS
jgi:hypothetical protein